MLGSCNLYLLILSQIIPSCCMLNTSEFQLNVHEGSVKVWFQYINKLLGMSLMQRYVGSKMHDTFSYIIYNKLVNIIR